MRRAIASLLLTILSVLLIAPFLVLDPQVDLPPCCRTHGRHHCMMTVEMRGVPDGLTRLSERCPWRPKCGGAAISRSYIPELEHRFLFRVVDPATPTEWKAVRPRRPFFESQPKRGPPALFA